MLVTWNNQTYTFSGDLYSFGYPSPKFDRSFFFGPITVVPSRDADESESFELLVLLDSAAENHQKSDKTAV